MAYHQRTWLRRYPLKDGFLRSAVPLNRRSYMGSLSNLSRRSLVKLGLASAGLPAFSKLMSSSAFAQDASSEAGKMGVVGGRAEEELFPGKALPGGGQLEIRLTASIYTSDPEALEIAQRLKPYDLESWIAEHTRIAERNEETAEKFASQGLNVTANEFYTRAANFYREAAWPQPVTEPRMLPTYKKARLMFDRLGTRSWHERPSSACR
jgi:hypothetical protein